MFRSDSLRGHVVKGDGVQVHIIRDGGVVMCWDMLLRMVLCRDMSTSC
jgi:hypothetical protein